MIAYAGMECDIEGSVVRGCKDAVDHLVDLFVRRCLVPRGIEAREVLRRDVVGIYCRDFGEYLSGAGRVEVPYHYKLWFILEGREHRRKVLPLVVINAALGSPGEVRGSNRKGIVT